PSALITQALGIVAALMWISAYPIYFGPITNRTGGSDLSWLMGLVVAGVTYYLLAHKQVREEGAMTPEHGNIAAATAATSPDVPDVAIVRSQLAHARIRVDLTRARAVPGVVSAVSAEDLADVRTMPEFVEWAQPVGRTVLARDRVRYVGAPIAAVAAVDRYVA